ncbi:MAG: glycoside hydrolase family 130 protein [Chitinispirillaceae bacterium]
MKVAVNRTSIRLTPDSTRVLIRPFIPSTERRIIKIISRVISLSRQEVHQQLNNVMQEFAGRHLDIRSIFLERFESVRHHMITDIEPEEEVKLLIGSYFTSEYALESAALFNPSIVPHPDQSGLADGALRFIMSLRAIGEGHISCISFRCGTIEPDLSISFEKTSRFVTTPDPITNAAYDKVCYAQKLFEIGMNNQFSKIVLESLQSSFTLPELEASIKYHKRHSHNGFANTDRTAEAMMWLAYANYEIIFAEDLPIGNRIIFPESPSEKKGIEDARFVLFTDDDGTRTYYASYTAYDGLTMLPQLIETQDFQHFRIITLNGQAAQNKGMALFPRKLNGKYAMLSRQDNENIFIMYSDNIHFWHEARIVMKPSYTWEFIQLGNCGSPIETSEGWLVLTHGVGAMRKYAIGAVLLDLQDPTRVISRLTEPLIEPNENEREGYVPNVVYTCGALLHQDTLILPYAMADYATGVATVNIHELLDAMKF